MPGHKEKIQAIYLERKTRLQSVRGRLAKDFCRAQVAARGLNFIRRNENDSPTPHTIRLESKFLKGIWKERVDIQRRKLELHVVI